MRASPIIALLVVTSVGRAQPASPPAETVPATAAATLRASVPACDPQRRHCFGLHVHVAHGDGGAVASVDWIAAQLAQANVHFAAIDVGFELSGEATLPAAEAHVASRAQRTALGRHVEGRVIHVFVTGQLDDVDTPDAQIYGVAWRKGGKGRDRTRKFIILSAAARDRTLAHELGHVFGLPHSSYPISLMNKTPRVDPPPDQRTFAPEELAKMKAAVARMIRARVLDDRARA